MEAQRRAAAAVEEEAGIWATGFSFCLFFSGVWIGGL